MIETYPVQEVQGAISYPAQIGRPLCVKEAMYTFPRQIKPGNWVKRWYDPDDFIVRAPQEMNP